MKTNRLSILKEGQNILRSIRSQRLWCLKHEKGYLESEWARTQLNNMENALATIKSSDQMKKYLREKQTVIWLLMPGKNLKNRKRLSELMNLNQ